MIVKIMIMTIMMTMIMIMMLMMMMTLIMIMMLIMMLMMMVTRLQKTSNLDISATRSESGNSPTWEDKRGENRSPPCLLRLFGGFGVLGASRCLGVLGAFFGAFFGVPGRR